MIGTRKSITTVSSRVCRWISSSFLVSLFGVLRHRAKQLSRRLTWTLGMLVLMVSGKSPDNFTVKSSSSFVAQKTRRRYDNEPAMRLSAEKVAAFLLPRTTILEPQSTRVLEELKEHIRVCKLQHER